MLHLLPASPIGKVLVGAVAGVAGASVIRPVLVGAVRMGLTAKDYAQSAWATAAIQARNIRAEAASGRVHSLETEVHALRAEIDRLKTTSTP